MFLMKVSWFITIKDKRFNVNYMDFFLSPYTREWVENTRYQLRKLRRYFTKSHTNLYLFKFVLKTN